MLLGIGILVESVRKAEKKVYIYDSFNRADGPAESTESGQIWESYGGSVWVIESGQLKIQQTGNIRDTILVNAGVADVAVQGRINSNLGRISFRATDHANQFFFGDTGSGSAYQLFRVQDGSATMLGSGGPKTIGDVLRVEVVGKLIKCFVNGTQVIEVSDSFNQTATKFGFSAYRTAGVLFDDFILEGL